MRISQNTGSALIVLMIIGVLIARRIAFLLITATREEPPTRSGHGFTGNE